MFPAETAQSALGSDVKDAVITVPFEFGEMQKNALRYVVEVSAKHLTSPDEC